jgi:hypothetical protein
MCINFPKTVRVLQNNERSFPLIFTITVVGLKVKTEEEYFYIPSRIFYAYKEITIASEGQQNLQTLAQCSWPFNTMFT